MRPFRNLKIASLIEQELNELILRNLDFNGAFVTITGVLVSEDLTGAKVRISVLPNEKTLEAFKLLQERRRELQYKLLRKMNIKPMPSIKFEIDKEAKAT